MKWIILVRIMSTDALPRLKLPVIVITPCAAGREVAVGSFPFLWGAL